MIMKYTSVLCALVVLSTLTGCYYDNEEELFQYVQQEECNVIEANYNADIVPILTAHCIRCHRNGREDGNVNLEGYNNVSPYVDNGALYGTTNHEPGWALMPTSGIKIPFCDIEKMRIWIESGALNN